MARSLRALIGSAALATAIVGLAHSPAQSQQNAAEKFVLSGVIVFEGGKGLAWLQEPTLTGNQVIPLRPGDTLGPYRLTRVLDDRVELEGPAGTVLVPVYGASGGPATSVAAASSARETAAVARVPRAADIEPAAMARREIRDATERLREAKQAVKRESKQAQNETPDDKGRGGRKGRRGSRNSDGTGVSSGSDGFGGGTGNSVTISRGDSRRSGFQNLSRSGTPNN